MYTYENYEGNYEYFADTVDTREDEQLFLEELGAEIEEKQERIDELINELAKLGAEIDVLRMRVEEIAGS